MMQLEHLNLKMTSIQQRSKLFNILRKKINVRRP